MSSPASWLSAPREGWTAAQTAKLDELNREPGSRKTSHTIIGWSLPKKVKR